MKRLVSSLLGAALLFGAAALGLQSGTANARDRHDNWRHHKHHRHHRHYMRNKLSY